MSDWYKEAVIYQIWPRSFYDANGDGIGDLQGVISKLDYLSDLGVNCIWFSPLYPTPNADYGYDVSDYMDINPEYGSLDIFKNLINEAHDRGMRVIMDLVINHTSDEHKWFIDSRNKDSLYHDYYFWKQGKGKHRPNNWISLFGGPAWDYDKTTDEYYLHLFDKKQPDLNHSNKNVREEICNIMKFWMDLGVDGFREDSITCIAKRNNLPNGIPIPFARGMEHYMNGPHIHDYLQQYRKTAKNYDSVLIGEGSPVMSPKASLKYTYGDKKDLDLMILFNHMGADCIFTDFIQRKFNLRQMKNAFSKNQKALNSKAWNTLYIENHDHPRIISRYGNETYRVESGKMLANMYMLQKGTPFIFQGQEIGMLNIALDSIDDYKDVSMKNNYYGALKMHMNKEKAFSNAIKSTRDNSRTPVQWSSGENAGFSDGTPWFSINPNYKSINVEEEENDPNSVLNHYKKLIRFKKENKVAIYGSYKEYCKNSPYIYVYSREYMGEKLLVINSFTTKQIHFKVPKDFDINGKAPILCNYNNNSSCNNTINLRPYESRVYYFH